MECEWKADGIETELKLLWLIFTLANRERSLALLLMYLWEFPFQTEKFREGIIKMNQFRLIYHT